jgi:hypothetical protein
MPHAQRTFQHFWSSGGNAFMGVDYWRMKTFQPFGSMAPNCVLPRFGVVGQ